MSTPDSPRGAVLVSGASTGIGHACAVRLARAGFSVHAGYRSPADGDRLRSSGLLPVPLDVTDSGQVREAARRIEGPLTALVNNAGIVVPGPLEFLPEEEFRHQLEVNLLGAFRLTQAFLPHLRRARGRILNMSSVSGRIAFPLLGAYAASKFALEGMSDALRIELASSGIEVILVEPGVVETPIWEKARSTARELYERMPPEAWEQYGAMAQAMQRGAEGPSTRRGISAEALAEVVHEALVHPRPKPRYLVGNGVKKSFLLAKLIGDRRRDRYFLKRLGLAGAPPRP